jgi:hypothetical protein
MPEKMEIPTIVKSYGKDIELAKPIWVNIGEPTNYFYFSTMPEAVRKVVEFVADRTKPEERIYLLPEHTITIENKYIAPIPPNDGTKCVCKYYPTDCLYCHNKLAEDNC